MRKLLRVVARTGVMLGGLVLAVAGGERARAADWPMLGRDASRNPVSPERGAPVKWSVGDPAKPGDGQNLLWEAPLGSESYGNPVVAEGVVWVGTNNEAKFDPRFQKDGGCLVALDRRTGAFLWQRYSPKLAAGRVNDWPLMGVCSSPLVEGGRLWYCTNRGEVVCLDVTPLRGGKRGKPRELWTLDMVGRLGVFPHNMTNCSPVAHGEFLYVITANGVDDTHKHIPAPQAPAIICLNKHTGAVVWTDNAPGLGILHSQWSSPAIAVVDGEAQVIAPLGDGWVYAYDALTGKIVWKFDSNRKETMYPTTRNELIATPVIVDNRMYIANGQDPEHGEGVGHLWCVDITGQGDVSAELPGEEMAEAAAKHGELLVPAGAAKPRKGKPNPNSGVVWSYASHGKPNKRGRVARQGRMNRSMSAVAVSDGMVFAPDYSGFLHCLDAETGKHLWVHDMEAAVWGSPLVAEGKVYLCDEDGDVTILAASRRLWPVGDDEALAARNLGSSATSSPVFTDGVLYLLRRDRLFAVSTWPAPVANAAAGGG